MVRRIAHPGKPIILVDLGEANGRTHWYAEARMEFDERLASRNRHEPVELRQPDRTQPARPAFIS